MTHSFDDMIMNEEKSGCSRMMFDIGRLERIEQIVELSKILDLTTLSVNWEEKWEVRHRTIITEIFVHVRSFGVRIFWSEDVPDRLCIDQERCQFRCTQWLWEVWYIWEHCFKRDLEIDHNDGNVVMINGRAQVCKIFRGMSERPDIFKMMFSKFKFSVWVNRGLAGLVRIIFNLRGAYVCWEVEKKLNYSNQQYHKKLKDDE